MPPAPARIAENIDVGRPEGQPLVDIVIPVSLRRIVFRAGFLRGYLGAAAELLAVEHCRKPYRLRKHCRRSRPRYSVKSLVPPVIGGKSRFRYRGGVIFKLLCLLLHGE